MKDMKIINVSIPPIITPTTAHFLFAENFKATRLTIRAMGEPNMTRAPPRFPSCEPHPGCKSSKQIYVRIGTSERPNPVLPSQFKFLFIGCPVHQVRDI
ncbi:MAG: hypothetical protein ACYS3N_18945 [Planctomycetota bacterium]|jgi:hypothetical protein